MQLLLCSFENHTTTTRDTHKYAGNMENFKPLLQTALTRFRLSSIFRSFTKSHALYK